MVDQEMLSALSIFTAYTIGGGILVLPDAAYSSGWLFSIFTLLFIALTFWAIYSVLILSFRETDRINYAEIVGKYYGDIAWKGVAVAVLLHCLLLICHYHICIVQLAKFAFAWMGAINPEKFSDYHMFWLELAILSITSLPLFLFGVYKKLESLRYIPIYIVCIWVYFVFASITDISIGIADRKHPQLISNGSIVLTAVESLNAVHCVPIICCEINKQKVMEAKKGIEIGLGIVFVLFVVTSGIGSNYHIGDVKGISLVHFSISGDNFDRKINYPFLIGIFGEIVSLSISILLALAPAKISFKQLYANTVSYKSDDDNNVRITFMLLFLTYAMSFLFNLNELSLQYIRDVVYLIFSLIYPFFICLKLESVPLINKILFGVWIWTLIGICLYDISERN